MIHLRSFPCHAVIPGITVPPSVCSWARNQKSSEFSSLQVMNFNFNNEFIRDDNANRKQRLNKWDGTSAAWCGQWQWQGANKQSKVIHINIGGPYWKTQIQRSGWGWKGKCCWCLWNDVGWVLVKTARMICIWFGIKGYKNKKNKAQTIKIIERWYKAKKVHQLMQEGYALIWEPRKEVQCACRLINILFSDEFASDFASDFASIGNVANREILDSGKARNKIHFWEQVQDAFVGLTDNENCNQLQFVDNAELSTLCTTLRQASYCSMIRIS